MSLHSLIQHHNHNHNPICLKRIGNVTSHRRKHQYIREPNIPLIKTANCSSSQEHSTPVNLSSHRIHNYILQETGHNNHTNIEEDIILASKVTLVIVTLP